MDLCIRQTAGVDATNTMATYTTYSPLLQIKLPHTCGDCGDTKRQSHMCATPLDCTPYLWDCWACHDQNHDPDVCRVVLAQMRQHNNGHCQNCKSRAFANWSLVCTDCTQTMHWTPCKGGCNRVGLVDDMCQYCMNVWAERASQNAWARKTRGCRGCGAPGYDGDYCSRDCMLD